ncbi:MAG: SOS response-associated peptidase [Lachnospiraceae bacterium]|nr:SOS response-associated peptidase [Lachnospiraceae bacterium]
MCSRYYIDDDTLDEVADRFVAGRRSGAKYTAGDVHPSETAPIIFRGKSGVSLNGMKWGFPQQSGKGLFINARAETALQKRTFSESVLYRRCVIPARHFYEWDVSKNKVTFLRESGSVLYMAGFFNLIQDEVRFVILTTQANSSVLPVHDRMPLILETEEVESWICDGGKTQAFLQKTPVLLQRTQKYEQQSLFGML